MRLKDILTLSQKLTQQEANINRYRDLIQDWQGFKDALSQPLPKVIWINRGRGEFEEILEEEGWGQEWFEPLTWHDQAYRVRRDLPLGQSLSYRLGLFHIQEEVSMLPPYLLNPRPFERILDLCAAPGNKTMQLALAMEQTGTLIANDLKPKRLSSLKIAADRLGITNLGYTAMDGRYFPKTDPFDRILADVPCSSEGTVRKNPRVLDHNMKPHRPFADGVQLGLLKRAIQLCKPGGRIVYSTCSFRPEENEWVIHKALQGGAVELETSQIPGFETDPGLTRWGSEEFSQDLKMCHRIWPHLNDSGGFFIACLRKT